jgi:broad specificity phosphatase PhoE
MKKIYFVRHGESQLNTENKEQGPHGSLSEHGRKQAEFVAKRFHTIPVECIVASPYQRAKETAEIINTELNKEILYTDFLIERRPPSKYIGASYTDDPEYVEVQKQISKMRLLDPSWKHSDEDNFDDLKTRAENALNLLHTLPHDSILAVTHAGILRVIIAAIIFGKDLTYSEYLKIYHTFKVNNTGITMVEYHEATVAHGLGWKLVAWNDHAHLGEVPS